MIGTCACGTEKVSNNDQIGWQGMGSTMNEQQNSSSLLHKE